MRNCPKCGTAMVRWGNGRTERWRCPPCSQIRRDSYHTKTALTGAPLVQIAEPSVVIEDTDLTLFNGDVIDVLANLPDESVHMAATSPPFYGLRDYGVEGQIGLEETPEEWVDRLVAVFRELRRVLRPDGTLWVEIGDSYLQNNRGATGNTDAYTAADTKGGAPGHVPNSWGAGQQTPVKHPFKQKDLLGQPWMLAFALRADGWYLRSEIIWDKPNAMPESIKDRPTRSHSTVFLLSKASRYYYDPDAIRDPFRDGNRGAGQGFRWNSPHYTEQEGPLDNTIGGLPPEAPRGPDGRRVTHVKAMENSHQHRDGERWPNPAGANARTVWSIPTEPTPFAHFATWPKKLVGRMIEAGTSEKGCCGECGAPWVRLLSRSTGEAFEKEIKYTGRPDGQERRNPGGGQKEWGAYVPPETIGWAPSCEHDAPVVPCVVLDPFAGSGTTLFVARALGRHSVGIELNPEYCQLAAERTQQLSLLT